MSSPALSSLNDILTWFYRYYNISLLRRCQNERQENHYEHQHFPSRISSRYLFKAWEVGRPRRPLVVIRLRICPWYVLWYDVPNSCLIHILHSRVLILCWPESSSKLVCSPSNRSRHLILTHTDSSIYQSPSFSSRCSPWSFLCGTSTRGQYAVQLRIRALPEVY